MTERAWCGIVRIANAIDHDDHAAASRELATAWSRWVEKPGERRRCFYRLTPEGRRKLAEQRETWKAFIDTIKAVMGPSRA